MSNLSITEELDFHYLLGLMPPLKGEPNYAWLPELFSVIGHKKLIDLCRYAGGETIKIPTVDELLLALESLQWFYDIEIKHTRRYEELPTTVRATVLSIKGIYDVRDHKG